MNKFIFAVVVISLNADAMDLSFETPKTNQEIAKFSGCFVAVKRGWAAIGYSLNDPTCTFAYVQPANTAVNFTGFTLADLKERTADMHGCGGMPMGMCPSPNTQVRFATRAELMVAVEKIKSGELQLGFIADTQDALKCLKKAAVKMNFELETTKRKEEVQEPLRRSKRVRMPAKKLQDYILD